MILLPEVNHLMNLFLCSIVFVFALLVLTTASSTTVPSAALQVIGRTTLGDDPRTVNRLNGESFQQDALVTFNGELPQVILEYFF